MRRVEKRFLFLKAYIEQILTVPPILFSQLAKTTINEVPGVYAIQHKRTKCVLYVGRTKNLQQRIYTNHLHGNLSTARLKKYLIEDPWMRTANDLQSAKSYLKNNCLVRYIELPQSDHILRGHLEGILTALLDAKYVSNEH
ncbi:GIY-YIG nuclease family protein [Aneurinibacillus aneurinilyticus]|uniref:GIY-YIG nuclease family protein n=1 Tax=Aneurinibacillus aneurinilyticus TaxID=1391 RepID=A0A848D4K2_ANEAE|nr:GIY-YIG nuclease family protein [Aneurinibacillus aneurinilyticus]NMF01143.1 GIY-YIG nuclease family protein [Aneurinibacillus aneurinilyticus]